jgi:hypothetical protein
MPYGFMASLIVAFTAATSFTFMEVVPFNLGKYGLYLVMMKVSLAAVWLWAAWRIKSRRERAFQLKQADGTLWSGEIRERALGIPLKDFEVIRYHYDADEEIEAVFRKHKFTLWEATLWGNIVMWALLVTGWMAHSMPALQWYPSDWHILWRFTIDHQRFTLLRTVVRFSVLSFRFVWWWMPLLVAVPAFYVTLKKWQVRKWDIRSITNRHIYLILEQPTYLPWVAPKFRPIPVSQVVGMSSEAGSFGGVIGWTNITLWVRADERDDEPERVLIDKVANGDEIVGILRRVVPVFWEDEQEDQAPRRKKRPAERRDPRRAEEKTAPNVSGGQPPAEATLEPVQPETATASSGKDPEDTPEAA